METIKPKAIIYARVSSDRQKNEGHGLESQEHRCREYARNRGYVIEKVFQDSASGGGDFMKRPAMASLLNYLDSKPYQNFIVIFDDLKRFARDTIFHWKLKTELQARNAKVECLNFTFEDTPEGEFIETILAAQGQLERQQNKRQVIQKMNARLEKGYWAFYPPPGYKHIRNSVHGNLLTREEPSASIIQEALEGYASGRFREQKDVLDFLLKRGFYDNKSKGKKIYLEQVKRLLTRVLYAGYIEYPDWKVSRRKGHHLPLISLDTFEKIQNKLNGKAMVRTRKDINLDFPLRGFATCLGCKQLLTASWSTGRNNKFPYYRCKTLNCSERNKSIKKEAIEKDFEEILNNINPREEILDYVKDRMIDKWNKRIDDLSNHHKQKEFELKQIESQIEDVTQLIFKAKNETVRGVYEDKLEELANKKLGFQDRVSNSNVNEIDFETATNKVFEYLKNPYSKWLKGSLADKRLVLKLVFTEELGYNRENGFGTAVLSLPLRVFEIIHTSKTYDVEMAGIEPACKRGSYMDLQCIVHLRRRSEFKRSG